MVNSDVGSERELFGGPGEWDEFPGQSELEAREVENEGSRIGLVATGPAGERVNLETRIYVEVGPQMWK